MPAPTTLPPARSGAGRLDAARRPWLVACVAAETIGMTAASAAAVVADRLAPGPALAVVVGGGLVEGAALAWFQGRVLAAVLPALSRVRYGVATVTVAGLGWAAASVPSVLAGDGADRTPPPAAVLVTAAGLGILLGLVLGGAQAVALRGAVPRPGRWLAASAVGWAPAMAVVFAGATTPDATWPAGAVVVTGAVTGAAAGTVLGLVTGWFLPSLDGPSAVARVVLHRLASPRAHRLRRALVGLELAGRRTGRTLRLPVQYAAAGDALAVVPGHAERKTWWRNVAPTPTPVRVLRDGAWTPARARRLAPGDPGYAGARAAYERRWRRAALPADQVVVLLEPAAAR